MKQYYKVISLLLIAILLTPLVTINSNAISEPTITVSDAEGAVGDTVDINIGLVNNPGIICAQLTVSYNSSALELVEVDDTGLLPGELHTPYLSSPYTLTWANNTVTKDYTVEGTIVALRFKIKNTASIGNVYDITVSYDYDNYEIYNLNFDPIEFSVQLGTITVVCPHADTTNVPEEPADCNDGGYTAGVYCNDCKSYISGRKPISATGEHTDADDKWENDEVNHFHTCSCGYIFDNAAHDGGTATCKEKAKCAECGKEYGQLNSTNHDGGTITVNASEPNHETQKAGYTGDTKCLGCGEIITYGQQIEPGEHTPADVWSNDENDHWKECNVVGCGVVIDGSKAPHSSDKAENKATCQKLAVCDVCGVSYGKLEYHNYVKEEKKQEALKTVGNCRDNAVYYYSCSVCGLVENDDNHTFLGDKVPSSHIGGTTLVNASEANHQNQIDGYTGDTKCLGCGVITVYGQVIPAVAHTPESKWTTDGSYHWKECAFEGCGAVIDDAKSEHKSTDANIATCQKLAVCDVCGVSYGAVAGHDFETTLCKDASGHWYACQTGGCDEKDGFAKHTPDHEGGATEEYPIKCTVCQYEIEAQIGHTHKFDKEVASEQYLAKKANCTDPAEYYKSCKCGEKGTETFTFGEKLGHTEGTAWEKDVNAHWHICTVAGCGVIIETSKTEHTPDREAATETDPILCSVCGYEIAPVLEHTHNHSSEWKSDKDNHWNECVCGDKANTASHEDGNSDGKCDICDHDVPETDIDTPQTGDNSMISLWIILLCVSGLIIALNASGRKKKMF